MEKRNRPYSVVSYDSAWARKFQKEKSIIAAIFKKNALSIEHIGSTSLKGMWAKPQIDILVTVKNLAKVNSLIISSLRSKGYVYQKNFFTKYKEKYFTRDAPSGERLFSLHVLKEDDPKAFSHLNFRDYLKTHSKARKLYSQIKRQAFKDRVDRIEYSKRKHKILIQILKQAKKWKNTRK